jgi:hypothetical protein
MSPEREELLLKIVERLVVGSNWNGPLTGAYPHRKCPHCRGEDSGYYDAQDFDHENDCPVELLEQLKSEPS